ncbi:hypothetical protein DYB36_010642 [Aphanomyces astaci]|uniref:Uncharacterized protein n=1 Tax=Aphanomyces astaci TaxID=112090 RepID=A0A397AH99_APHAT|nr:hypothetical protein DYB36_010642 [Aphanomyces astaci]
MQNPTDQLLPPMPQHANKPHASDAPHFAYTHNPSSSCRAVKRSGDVHVLPDTYHRVQSDAGGQVHATTPSNTSAETSEAPSMLCKYVYKPCTNPRTLKRNGELHSLCAQHQAKANSCQKQYAKKKRKLSKPTGKDLTYPMATRATASSSHSY